MRSLDSGLSEHIILTHSLPSAGPFAEFLSPMVLYLQRQHQPLMSNQSIKLSVL